MDWQTLISDLTRRGVTQIVMAARAGCSQSTISEIFKGKIKDPAYSIGRALVDFHEEMTEMTRSSVALGAGDVVKHD